MRKFKLQIHSTQNTPLLSSNYFTNMKTHKYFNMKTESNNKPINRIMNFLYGILTITILCLVFTQSLFSQSGWVAQTLPVTGQIDDMAFLNKDTGFIAMGSINTLMRTMNGGTNWDIIRDFRIYQLEKIDTRTLYAINYNGDKLYRTYDGGTSWDSISVGGWCGISFINKDTGWISTLTGIYKTTNAGVSNIFLSNTVNCGKIVFLKENYSSQYSGFIISSGALFKSTNSGMNWVNVPNTLGAGTYSSIFFLNKDTGWCYFHYNIKPSEFIYTSNSGSNWNTQYVDSIGYGSLDLIFDKSGKYGWTGGMSYQKIFATSNGGLNWGFQNIPITFAYYFSFCDSLIGYCGQNSIAKTTNGGGAITYIGIDSINSKIPVAYKLNQNYPNPFNPSTTISFSLLKENYVGLKIYDITGKEILILYDNKFLQTGNYKANIDFNYINVPSGVYFYTLTVYGKNNSTVFKETKKMLYLK